MKTGTAVFRVIVLVWLAGLTILCLGQAVTMVRIKNVQLGIAQMLAANANLTTALCKATAPGDYQDAELQRILVQISACRTWDDLVKMP
jgi:hypothetical protein